jgi:hypothetical protein
VANARYPIYSPDLPAVIPRSVVFIHEIRNGSAKMKARRLGAHYGIARNTATTKQKCIAVERDPLKIQFGSNGAWQ